MTEEVEGRFCTMCGAGYTRDSFYHLKKNGKPFARCISCHLQKKGESRRTESGIVSTLYRSCRHRSDLVTISRSWIEERIRRGVCEVTGLPLDLSPEPGPRRPLTPSIDQIRPGMGYTEENSRLVCWIYNSAKSTWTHETLVFMASALISEERRRHA